MPDHRRAYEDRTAEMMQEALFALSEERTAPVTG